MVPIFVVPLSLVGFYTLIGKSKLYYQKALPRKHWFLPSPNPNTGRKGAYIVMAYIVMAYAVMAYIVMVYAVMDQPKHR